MLIRDFYDSHPFASVTFSCGENAILHVKMVQRDIDPVSMHGGHSSVSMDKHFMYGTIDSSYIASWAKGSRCLGLQGGFCAGRQNTK